MKHKLYHKLTAAVCALALLLSLTPAALAEDLNGVSAPSKNINRPTYYNGFWETENRSHLYANEKGGLTRVEYFGNDEVVVEEFDSNFQFQYGSRKIIKMELPEWGTFYAGAQYNFLILGQNNPSDSDSVEVIRVIKYDKNWNRLGAASVYGANTSKPFEAGATRCTESNGILYIHTCHEMYKSSDGKNHQSNMNVAVRVNDMAVLDGARFASYVSHSFNHFILVDQDGAIITANHGDANPRAMYLGKYKTNDTATGSFLASAETDAFPGAKGSNNTGAELGGLAETSSGYLISYAQRVPGLYDPYQIKVSYIAKKDLTSSQSTFQTRQITNDSAPTGGMLGGIGAPVLVPAGLNGGYIIWVNWLTAGDGVYTNRTIHFATYDANGNVGQVYSAPGAMSDCQPILFNGKVVWYTTDALAPVFYTLDGSSLTSTPTKDGRNPNAAPTVLTTAVPAAPSGISSKPGTPSTPSTPAGNSPFQDVGSSHWALSSIQACVDKGIVSGYGNGKFGPDDPVTDAQFLAMITRTFYPFKVSMTQTVINNLTEMGAKPSAWYEAYVSVADSEGITRNLETTKDTSMSRYEMAVASYNTIVANNKIASGVEIIEAGAKLKDRTSIPQNYLVYVEGCVAKGIITGMSDGTFSGDKTMTRAQACVVMQRMIELLDK